MALEPLIDGLELPVFAAVRPQDPHLYIVEQSGAVLPWDGSRLLEPLVDLRGQVARGYEQGLLGLAFQGPHAYVHYTASDGDSVLAAYRIDCGHGACTASSPRVILEVGQPYSNHNGGMLAFGRDGHLYVALGDGGSGGDPHNHAQDLGSLLGKILRLDVAACADQECPYRVPPSNPFAATEGARGEIWAYGLRNPWRFSFDRGTGDLWIGDVGQNAWEEVDRQPSASEGGENYGWSRLEGFHVHDASRGADDPVAPVAEYARAGGACAVTGGYVYRGTAIPGLAGTYVFADHCLGDLWGLRDAERFVLLETGLRISSFAEDHDGELLVIDLGGSIHRLVAAAPAA